MFEQMTIYILPIVLFIINLVIILAIRENDSRKRGLTGVKKLTDQFKSEIGKQVDDFRNEVAELDHKVAEKDKQLRGLIQTVGSEIEKLNTYQDDMANLRHCMDTYREALAGLAKLTNDADSKITMVENDVQRLEEVRNMIDSFRLDMKDADEHLKVHESTVIQLQKDTVSELEMSVNNFREEAEKVLAETKTNVLGYCDALEEKVEATKTATGELHNEALALMEGLGDRLNDHHVLATQIAELTKTRNELAATLDVLEKQVAEKKSLAADLDNATREQSDRLASIKLSIDRIENERFEASSLSEKRTEKPVEEPVAEEPQMKEPEEDISDVVDDLEDNIAQDENKDEIIIEDEESEKVEYYGEEEEIVF